MEILYEDSQIAVIVKPAGMASQSTPRGDDCVAALRAHTGGEIFAVHRLDTPTTGVMVYARTKQAAAFLSKEMAEGRFQKEYLALVHGRPVEPSGGMEDWLYKDARNKTYVVKRERKGVKKAILSYETLQTCADAAYGTLSLVRIRLQTGRTHQIRVQFASRKMPVLGDGKYGAKDNAPFLGLACCRLTFRHPQTGEEMTFTHTPAEFYEKVSGLAD